MIKKIILIALTLVLFNCTMRIYKVDIAGDCKEFKVEALVEVPKEITVNADGKLEIPLIPSKEDRL